MDEMFISAAELAERYPVESADCLGAWYRLLQRWRDQRRIREGEQWKLRRFQGSTRPILVYREAHILRLVCQSDHSFAISVRIENKEAIRRTLAAFAAPVAE